MVGFQATGIRVCWQGGAGAGAVKPTEDDDFRWRIDIGKYLHQLEPNVGQIQGLGGV